MSWNKTNLYDAVKYETSHKDDDQLPDAFLDLIVPPLYIAFRRLIVQTANKLYSAYSTPAVLTSAATSIALPADFEQVIRVEKLEGTQYMPVDKADDLNPEDSDPRAWDEQEGLIRVYPASAAAGTYRMLYNKKPDVTGTYTVEVPEGCEVVLMHEICKAVRPRFNEDVKQHVDAIRDLWTGGPKGAGQGLMTQIRRRYGNHPVPGFRSTQGGA